LYSLLSALLYKLSSLFSVLYLAIVLWPIIITYYSTWALCLLSILRLDNLIYLWLYITHLILGLHTIASIINIIINLITIIIFLINLLSDYSLTFLFLLLSIFFLLSLIYILSMLLEYLSFPFLLSSSYMFITNFLPYLYCASHILINLRFHLPTLYLLLILSLLLLSISLDVAAILLTF
jgi:hypothetical protein